jgi:subfamily B ATP-binding cassette protein MsbA
VQDSRDLYLRLLGHVRPHWKGFVLTLAATALAAATEPLFPALMKPLLDKGFGQGDQGWLAWLPLAIVGIFVLRGVAGFFASYGMSWVSNKVITDLRQLMFERLMRLPASYFDAHASSVPATRIAYDVNGVAAAATSTLTVLIRDTLSVIGLVAWLLWLNWKLTLISLAVIPLTALVVRAFSKRLRKLSLSAQEGMAQMNEVLQESIRGHKVVKIFGGEQHATARFFRVNNALRGYGMRQAIAAAAVAPITQIFASVGLAIVVWVALQQSAGNETTVGGFVSFITAMLLLLAPLKHLADINAPLQRGLAAAESVFRMLDEATEVDTGSVTLGRARGEIEFTGVGLRYAGAERDALTGIDVSIRPGETVALVGPSGGGKTSLVNLVPRFYHAGHGQIRIDGHDIETLTLGSLRANIAHVGQDVFLFDDTVAANIAYGGKCDAGRHEIEAAARAANAFEFIERMAQGFRHDHRRKRRTAFRRPAPAHRHRTRHTQGRTDPDPRRSHLRARQRIRTGGTGSAGSPDAGAHHTGHRTSTVHRRTCRSNCGAGTRTDCRDRQSCAIAGGRRRLCQPLPAAVRGGRVNILHRSLAVARPL